MQNNASRIFHGKLNLFLLSSLAIGVFLVVLFVRDIPARMTHGNYGQVAIASLDEVRRPFLEIHAVESLLMNEGYSESVHTSLDKSIKRGRDLIGEFKQVAQYSPVVVQRVERLGKSFESWVEDELAILAYQSRMKAGSRDNADDMAERHLLGLVSAGFSRTMDYLGEVEGPIHDDIHNGSRAATELTVLSGVLMVLLLGGIYYLQWSRNKVLRGLLTEVGRFKSTLDQTLDCVFMFDADSLRFFYVNEGALQQLGYTREEMLALHPYDIKPEYTEPQFREMIAPLLRGEQASCNVETIHQHKNGQHVPVEIFLQYIAPKNEPARFVAIVRNITERKQAEEELRASEQEYRTLIESSHEVVFCKDRDGHYHTINLKAAVGLGGTCIEDIVGKTDYDLMPKEKADALRRIDKQVMENNEAIDVEEVVRNTQGEDRVYFSRKWPTYDNEGKVAGVACFAMDITDHKQAEEAIRFQSEIIGNMAEGVNLVRSSDAIIVYTNPKFDEMFGYDQGELIEKHASVLNAGTKESLEKVAEITACLNETGTWQGEIENIKKDGTSFWCHCNVSKYQHHEQGEVFVSVQTDITARKIVEEKLRESEKRNRTWLEHSPACTKIVDLDFNLQYMSEAGIKGLDIEDITPFYGKPYPFDFYPKSFRNTMTRNLERVRETGKIIAQEAAVVDTKGDELWFHSTLVPVNDDEGRIDYIIIVSIDTTKRKKAEVELDKYRESLEELVEERTTELQNAHDELIRKERLATLGQLTATVSHELRNPLGAMRPSLYVIEKNSDKTDERVQKAIERVDRNIDRCDHIIDELLDFTRITTLDRKSIRIDEWLESVIDDQNIIKNIRLEKEFSLDDFELIIDTGRLRRAVINTMDNACHAMMNNKQTGAIKGARLCIKTRGNGQRIEIIISDNGAGIPDDVLEKIFEPLFSTKGFGVGLGMPTVKQIMEQHSGGVEINTEEGKGTTVTLWLPKKVAGEDDKGAED